MRLGSGWRRLFRLGDPSAQVTEEVDAELHFHLESRVEELIRTGMTPSEARDEARRQFGDLDRIRSDVHSMDRGRIRKQRRAAVMEILLHDVRFALRMLRRNLGFATIAIGTIALGIGANTAIFSVVNGVLLRRLPYAEPEQLVMVWLDNTVQGFHEDLTSYPNYAALRDQNSTLQDFAAFTTSGLSLTGDGDPERLPGVRVSGTFFNVMGVPALLGRTLVPEEDEPGNDGVVVLGHGLWLRRFGGDADVVGTEIILNGRGRTVVGVMPPAFRFPENAQVWIPMAPDEAARNRRGGLWLWTVGRMLPEATVGQARDDLGAVMSRLEEEFPRSNAGFGAAVNPLQEQLVGDVRTALLVLAGAVGFVLLIACANVANLILARAAAREGEIAVRAALGAGRGRIAGQLLTESAVLAMIAAPIGIAIAVLGVDAMIALAPADLPRLDEVSLDGRVLGFTVGISLLAGVLFGLAPAIQASRPDLSSELKEGGATRLASPRHFLRRLLVVSEIALALVLLVGAGLMIKSFGRLNAVDPGFAPDHLLTMRITPAQSRYESQTQLSAFYDDLLERIAALPGVRDAGATSDILVAEFPRSGGFNIEGRPDFQRTEFVEVLIDAVTPNYFGVMGVPLIQGRFFEPSDGRGQPRVVIINETMAEMFWPDEDPIGQRITFGPGGADATWRTIVGVVGDVNRSGLDRVPRPATYLSQTQTPFRTMTVVVRTELDPLDMAAAARQALWALDPDQPITSVSTMDAVLAETVAQRRFNMILLGVFASVALVMAAAGVYGVMAYSVAQRARELGIRIALGARGGDVLRMVVGQGMRLAGLGVVAGLIGAAALSRLIASLLFGVSPTDVVTFAVVALGLIAVAAVACFVPARRATRADSMLAIRSD